MERESPHNIQHMHMYQKNVNCTQRMCNTFDANVSCCCAPFVFCYLPNGQFLHSSVDDQLLYKLSDFLFELSLQIKYELILY